MRIRQVLVNLLFILNWMTFQVNAADLSDLSIQAFPFLNQLPSNDMSCVFQDRDGLIWTGTIDGLCRYDGYNVHVFRSGTVRPDLLPDNNVRTIAETKDGRLLIGTLNGMSVFDKVTNQFTTLDLGKDLTGYEVRSIVVDRDGYCWIGSYKKLMRISPDLKQIKSYSCLPVTSVNTVYMDRDGGIWVGFWNKGLYRYDRKRDTFVAMPRVGNDNNPFRVFQDRQKRYWVSTWGDGVYSMYPDRKEGCFEPVRISMQGKVDSLTEVFGFVQDNVKGYLWMVDFKGMSVASIGQDRSLTLMNLQRKTADMNQLFNSVFMDRSGNIWFASASDGGYIVSFSDSSLSMFTFPTLAAATNGLSVDITALYQDVRNNFWICQNRWGLGWYNPVSKSLRFYHDVPGLSGNESLGDVTSITSFPANPEEVWIAPRFRNFVYVFRLTAGVPVLKQKFDLQQVKSGKPIGLYQDKRRFVWVITTGSVITISPSGQLRKVEKNIHDISALTGDEDGNIWIGTSNNGLYKLVTEFRNNSYAVKSLETFNKDDHKFPSNRLKSICMDPKRKSLWIGTMEGHVLSVNTMTGEVTDYSDYFAGYTNSQICDIRIDKFGHVWVAMEKMVIEFDPESKGTHTYAVKSVTGMTSFVPGAVAYNGGNAIYYGGQGGIARFNVTKGAAASNVSSAPLVTDLKVKGMSILDGGLSEDYSIDTKLRKLVLGADARDVEIYFSTLDYLHPERILYAYRIKGLNNDWVYPKEDFPRAYYNDLPKGTYTLEIRTTDENGKWNENVLTYTIVRLPAWYETWWAYTLYLLTIAGTGLYAYSVIKRRIRLKNELRIAKIENERNEELTSAKLRYFTNISHDFLTPISIISCLIDDIGMTYRNHIPQLDKMRASLSQLKRLIQQVLDFRKLENGKMQLSVSKGDLALFTRTVCRENFEPLMDKKHINFVLNLEEDTLPAWFDEDKLEKVLYNLLSNACKYTGEGGTVTVSLTLSEEGTRHLASIRVADTGQGIPREDCKRIFNRFYTVNSDKTVESNGIGLALVKELVDLHHASIRVASEVGVGTTFTLTLPIDESSYLPNERTPQETLDNINDLELTDSPITVTDGDPVVLQEVIGQKLQDDTCMLIVDDNQDLLDVMNRIFSRHRRVLLAHNGNEALAVIANNEVDIVISDVMMPEMDGLELCRRLKSNIETSHIPVILLTAKNSPEDRVECYEAGADGYIAKPFELNVLEARVENFLNRKKISQREFKKNPEKKVDSLKVSPLDQKFLDQITVILEKNMVKANDIDIELITREVAMSKSSFYRKMKSITGLSPIEYIKNFRLKRAYKLIENGAASVADVAYSSGFSNTKYFSTCFKEEFGMTPSEFLKRNQ